MLQHPPVVLFLKATIPGGAGDLFALPVQVAGYTTPDGTYVAPHTAIRHKRTTLPAAAPKAAAVDLFAHADAAAAPPKPAGKAKPKADTGPDLFSAILHPPAPAKPASEVAAATAKPPAVVESTPASGPAGLRTAAVGDVLEIDLPYKSRSVRARVRVVEPTYRDHRGSVVLLEKPPRTTLEVGRTHHVDQAVVNAGTLLSVTPALTAAELAQVASAVAPAPAPAQAAPVGAPAELATFGVEAGISEPARRALNAAAVAVLTSKPDADMTDGDRAVLARYSGTGGCGASRNEFYTTPAIARAMWSLLDRAGFHGGEVLEPSCGTGVFLHTAPPGAHVVGVEMDPIGARISGILHRPAGHEVNAGTLEAFAQGDGRLFDAVIGNPPFGIRGGSAGDDKKSIASAEDYFLDTALDKLRSGGLLAMIVPTGVMDGKAGRGFREALLCKGEFLGGSRLPNTAFEASHTAVTSDVLLFRRRPQEVAGALSTVDQDVLQQLGVWDEEFLSGSYFVAGRGAANIHGNLEPGWREKANMGHDITVSGSMVGVPDAVRDMPIEAPAPSPDMATVLAALGDDDTAKRRAVSAALRPPYQVAKLGDVQTVDGIRYVLQGEPPRWHRADEDLPPAVADALGIAEVLEDLHEGRAADPAMARAGLIEDLDAYVGKHGTPGRSKALRAWLAKPSMPNLDGVGGNEHGERVNSAYRRVARLLGAVGDDGGYSDLVTGVTRQADAASLDTMATRLSLERGGFTAEQLAAVTGGTADQVLDHLFASPAYAVEPDGRTWSTLDSYVSGALWPKFDAATEAAATPGADPALVAKWASQAAVLDAAIAPASLEDVEIALNSGFIQPAVINAWFQAQEEARRAKQGRYGPQFNVAELEYKDALWSAKDGRGVNVGDTRLILTFLNRTGVRKVDRAKLVRLNAEFADWVRGSDLRQSVEDGYNRTHKGFIAPVFSDKPIDIPGLNPPFSVNNYHWSGLRWAMQAGSGIVADDVGLGKTPRGLMLSKLMQSTGQAKKPVIVVPKSVLANWVKEAEQWFPGAKILVIGETYKTDKAGNVTSKSDDAETRQEKFHNLQQNSHDFVFISQPAWNELDVSPDLKAGYQSDDFWTQRGEAMANAKASKIERARAADEQRVAVKEFESREGTVYFDELGIDALIMDEGHAYKNLYSARARFGEKPKFLGGSGESNRAQDTYYKTRALRSKNGGKGVFMLTATPTKNSPLEIYSMLAQIAPEAFEKMGIRNSEAFLDRFCEFSMDMVPTIDGGVDEELVTSGFKNLDELREVMKRYIDRRTAADVGLVIPKGLPVDHYVDMSPAQEEAYQELRAQYAAVADGTADATGESHIFSIMNRMGKASLDLSLLDPSYHGERAPKVDACVDAAIEHAGDGGQIIFCDANDMHERIAASLVARGVPRNRIGIINATAAEGSAARQKICDQFNSGKLGYVIGNTATMGEGVNLQKGTSDIHHLDLPWEPASMHQRNGRGVRQGNKKGSVRLHTYLAKGSFDGYRLATMMAKKDWQDLLWNGGDKVENLSRSGANSRSEVLIMMSANPDEARKAYDANKSAAVERRRAEDRGQAIAAFDRFDKMGRALAKLRAEQDPLKVQAGAIARLEKKRQVLHGALRDLPAFTHKDLLDHPHPAVIEPVTNHAWTRGRGLVLHGGSEGPANWSEDESRWVVTGVDADAGTVSVRGYGGNSHSDRPTLDFDLKDMKAGVTPFDYSEKAEKAEVADADTAYRTMVGQRTAAKMANPNGLGLVEMRDLPPDVLANQADLVRSHMRLQIERYRDGHSQVYGLTNHEGRPVAAQSFEVRKLLGDHDLILPTPDGRAKAVEGYVDAAMRRGVVTPTQTGTRMRSYNGASMSTAIKPTYEGFEHSTSTSGNPWEHVIKDVFGEDATAAQAAVREEVKRRIDSAPTFRDAVIAATKGVEVPAYGWGTTSKGNPWPADVVRSLAARAAKDKVLDWDMHKAAKPSQSSYKPDLHPELLKHGGVNYAADMSQYGNSRSHRVRDFLEAISHPADKAALKAAP